MDYWSNLSLSFSHHQSNTPTLQYSNTPSLHQSISPLLHFKIFKYFEFPEALQHSHPNRA
jgi:hypothetical protein